MPQKEIINKLMQNKDLNISLHDHHHDLQILSACSYRYTINYFLLVNKGTQYEHKVHFEKYGHAIDYFNAYVEQKRDPKVLFLDFKVREGINGIWGPKFSVDVVYGYSERNLTDKVSFEFSLDGEVNCFIDSLRNTHSQHVKSNVEFGYHQLKLAHKYTLEEFDWNN